jgi:hypothetical protein
MSYLDDISAKKQNMSIISEKAQLFDDMQNIQRLIAEASAEITKSIDSIPNVVSVDNFPTPLDSIKTPDIDKVVVELSRLKEAVAKKDPADKTSHELLKKLITAVGNIKQPDKISIPDSVKVNNLKDYTAGLKEVVKAVESIKLEFDPQIVVKPSDVIVEPDLKSIEAKLDTVTKAIKSISIIIPENDDTKIIQSLKKVSDTINNLRFPVPNYVLPFKGAGGEATQAQLTSDGKIPVEATIDTGGLATESTLSKLVGFDANANLTGSITTTGAITVIVKTDGVKTLTKTIDETDPNDIITSQVWS